METAKRHRHPIITLCGSTRFKKEFLNVQKSLTLQGYVVISVGLFAHSGDDEVWEGMPEDTVTKTKIMLDDMHKQKIDMADEIYVIDVDGYIGESTKSEIDYAFVHGKPIHYYSNGDLNCGLIRQPISFDTNSETLLAEIYTSKTHAAKSYFHVLDIADCLEDMEIKYSTTICSFTGVLNKIRLTIIEEAWKTVIPDTIKRVRETYDNVIFITRIPSDKEEVIHLLESMGFKSYNCCSGLEYSEPFILVDDELSNMVYNHILEHYGEKN